METSSGDITALNIFCSNRTSSQFKEFFSYFSYHFPLGGMSSISKSSENIDLMSHFPNEMNRIFVFNCGSSEKGTARFWYEMNFYAAETIFQSTLADISTPWFHLIYLSDLKSIPFYLFRYQSINSLNKRLNWTKARKHGLQSSFPIH